MVEVRNLEVSIGSSGLEPDCEHEFRPSGSYLFMHARSLPDGRQQMFGLPTENCRKCWHMKPVPMPCTLQAIGEPYVPSPPTWDVDPPSLRTRA